MRVGDRIRRRREQLGISQTALADKISVSKQTLYKYENNIISNIPSDKVESAAKVLHTTPAYLMGWEDSSTIPPGFDPLPRTVKKPLVGEIACGDPITAEQNIVDYVDVPENIHCDFCLRCRGDSMIDAHIEDGDIVYIRIQPEVHDGEIAAVRIGDEATLKRVYYDGKSITLVPANSAYRPKTYSGPDLDNIHIEGKAVGFTHWY